MLYALYFQQVCMQNFAAKPQHRVHTHDTYIIASF